MFQFLFSSRMFIAQWLAKFLILQSKPIKSNNKLATMVCISKIGHAHLWMYLVMIKSFVFYASRQFKIIIIDDGSLTKGDIQLLKQHVFDCRIVSRGVAEKIVLTSLSKYPFCKRFYQEKTPTLYTHNKTLFETLLLHNQRRFIVLDADIIFFHKPRAILQWITKKMENALALSFEPSYARKELRWGRLVFRTLSKLWRSDIPMLFNDGILCSTKESYQLPIIENCLKHVIYPMKIQGQWLSIIVLHAAVFASKFKTSTPLTFLDWESYRIATRLNIDIHTNPRNYTAIHYIAENKKFWPASALHLLIKTRMFTTLYT